ncbi:uncharacterized protein LOC134251500 [Saccostrea cucullata]|uniref:uncharacterized protein LOC134251500 n=1 Tax=Saccostrea cuccullata TaxID=36930 RepID=UPI002ED3BB1C
MALQKTILLSSVLLSVCWGALQDHRNVPQYHELMRQGHVKLTQGESEPDFIHRFNGTIMLQKMLSLDSMYDQAVLLNKEFMTHFGSRIKMSGGCVVGLQLLLDGLKERSLWSLKMLDAIGKVPSGIFDGDFMWHGQYDECNTISQAFTDRITLNENSLVRGKYFVAGLLNPLGYNTTDLKIGVCLPDACTATDVKEVLELAFLEMYKIYKQNNQAFSEICVSSRSKIQELSRVYCCQCDLFHHWFSVIAGHSLRHVNKSRCRLLGNRRSED